jgi:hypothetical protein
MLNKRNGVMYFGVRQDLHFCMKNNQRAAIVYSGCFPMGWFLPFWHNYSIVFSESRGKWLAGMELLPIVIST